MYDSKEDIAAQPSILSYSYTKKKVRCDGAHPFCTRCQSTGSSCSYPSSRRSRNTQPHHVDPYIDHLSQLEHHIRQIESDMANYRSMLISTFASSDSGPNSESSTTHPQEDILRSHLTKTEQEVQESRTILAQLRLRGEQRIARTKRNQTKEAKQKQQQQQQRTHPHGKKKPSATTGRSKPSPSPGNSKPDASPSMDNTSSLFLDHRLHHQQPYGSSSSATRPAPPPDLTTSHVPSFLSLNTTITTSADSLYSSSSYAQQQQPDLYYMSGGSRAYYDPMMEYPWTTPTDFSNEAATTLKHETTKDNRQGLWVKTGEAHPESAHYSPSTVAAIEEVTRLAQHSLNGIHADRGLN